MKSAAVLLLVLLFGLTGCGRRNLSVAPDTFATTVPTQASWKTTSHPFPNDVKTTLLTCTVRLRCEVQEGDRAITAHGTAFGIDLSAFGFPGRRYLLTAAHNVLGVDKKPYGAVTIEMPGATKRWVRCTAVVWDEGLDLALVKASEDLPGLLRFSDADLAVGARVILAGSPRGIPVDLFPGTLEQKFQSGLVNSRMKVAFDHGDSGGPVVDAANARVIGVAVAGLPKDGDLDHESGLFVPTVAVVTFLERHGPGRAMPSSQRRSSVAVRRDARRTTKSAEPNATQVATPRTSSARLHRPSSGAEGILAEFE